jgi:tetratricopeptide (TPR) repeat protein
MTTPRADDRRPRSAAAASEGLHSLASAAQTGAAPALEIACPVCATFNSSLFRYCPQCGYLLRTAPLREPTPVQPAAHKPGARWLVHLLWLVVVVETGLLGGFWLRSGGWPWPTRPMVLSRAGSAPDGSAVTSAQRARRAAPGTMTAPHSPGEGSARPTGQLPDSTLVSLVVFDREGDILRHTRGTWFPQAQRIVTTYTSMRGAYRAVVRFADHSTRPIQVVERADAEENVAVLALDAPRPMSPPAPLTLEALARTTYEETPAQHRYLADKRTRAQRWEEALTHWQRLHTLDPVLQPEDAVAFTETVLHASSLAQAEGRTAEAHGWLLEAVAWVPEIGDLRLRLAESFGARGAYSDVIAQYTAALPLLPAQAAVITNAIVRWYQTWGQEQLRQGHLGDAARLFRTALEMDSTNGELYFALGQAEWRQRALDTAIEAFEAALTYAPILQPEVEPYLTKAQALRGGPQTAVIDFPPGARRIEVSVVIDGRLEVSCIVDTGATVTLLPLWVADDLGYRRYPPSAWGYIQTAGGPRRLPSFAVRRLEIQGLSVGNLPVVFGDLPGTDGSKGLLGMDVLRYFALAVDHDIGRMTLRLP